MEGIGFWDIALLVYLVGLVLAFVLIHDRLARPECYRIPFAIAIALFWPLVLLMFMGLYIEGLLYDIKEWILKDRE